MATNNAVNVPLSGSTGTGAFVGSTSPTLVTPNIGVATATSVTFSPTTNGIVGTPTNDNASSGIVGEFIFSQVLQVSAVPMTNSVTANITSISLPAGDWDVEGNVLVNNTNSLTNAFVAISTTSATLPDNSLRANMTAAAPSSTAFGSPAPYQRFSLSITTTIFLVAFGTFSSGTCSGSGGIYARRVR